MTQAQDCRYFFNSTLHTPAPAGFPGEWIDLAADPSAAHRLIRLGVSPRTDLPAVTVEEPGGKLRVLGLRLTSEEALALAAGKGVAGESLRVFGTTWCPDCRGAKRILADVGTSFDEVNLDLDPKAEALVLARSGGRRVVPTLLLDDRVWLFNPAPARLQRFAGSLGSLLAAV